MWFVTTLSWRLDDFTITCRLLSWLGLCSRYYRSGACTGRQATKSDAIDGKLIKRVDILPPQKKTNTHTHMQSDVEEASQPQMLVNSSKATEQCLGHTQRHALTSMYALVPYDAYTSTVARSDCPIACWITARFCRILNPKQRTRKMQAGPRKGLLLARESRGRRFPPLITSLHVPPSPVLLQRFQVIAVPDTDSCR